MIFSELYSVYYNTVAKIIEAAFNPEATEKDLQRCVVEEAFSESVLTILPALKSENGRCFMRIFPRPCYISPQCPLPTWKRAG